MAEQMKSSRIDWIGDVPKSWDVEPIKYRVSFYNGDRSENYPSKNEIQSEGIPFINAGHIEGNCLNMNDMDYISEEKYRVMGGVKLQQGDILYCLRGSVGKNIVVNIDKGTVASSLVAIRSNGILNKYLYYCLNSNVEEVQRCLWDNGTAQPNLSADSLGKFKICIPPDNEQQAIADFLDKECAQIDSIAADLEKQIALLQQYKKSLITETVTKGLDKSVPMKDSGVEFFGKIPAHWKVSKTKYVADISIGLVTTMTANYVDEDGVPLIRNSNIRTNHIDDNGMVYLSKEFAKANIGRALHKGDIVTVHTGDVGTSAIINETYHMSHGFATIISRLKTKTVNNQFLCWLYNSEIFKEMSIAYSTGDGRQNLNLYDFVDFYILIPTLKEQMEIVNWLNLKCTEIDNFIENKQQQLLLIQQHKKSLIYEYVTGKKRVKEVQ